MSLWKIETEDLEALQILDSQCFPEEPWPKHSLLSHLERHIAFFWEKDPKMGYALLCVTPWEVEIFRIGIHPHGRNQGKGKAFLLALFAEFPNLDFFLEVKESNQTAFVLYERVGFATIDKRRNYYSDGADALILKRSPNT